MYNGQIKVDVDLLKKYDRSGPRYTSYPTAPYFNKAVNREKYLEHIRVENSNQNTEPLSLYFHIPFCDTLCYFCGCNMMVTRNKEKIDTYLEYLKKEMQLLKKVIHPDRKVIQMHWGGGTPTHLSPDQIKKLGHYINRYFDFHPDAEISVEIDPRELSRSHLEALRSSGFNRTSMGVQDFDANVQKTINRVQPESVTRQVVDWTRELGFESINLDLMYGLPFQTVQSFGRTIDKTIQLNPDRLAVFNYAHLPEIIKHQKLIKDWWLPSAEVKLELLKMSIEKLTANGYVYIGMDHFAKPQDELTVAMNNQDLYRNFQGYSTHAGLTMHAIGMTSISMLPGLYVQNHKTLKAYYNDLDNDLLPVVHGIELTDDDILRRDVITQLMCNFKIEKNIFEKKYSIDFDSYFRKALDGLIPFAEDGLIEFQDGVIKVTVSGRLLIRNIAMNFDAYLEKKQNQPRYSRTV